MNRYFRLMRPEHYIKNLFMYLPLFFTFQLFDFSLLKNVSIGFFSFSLIASCIYIFNDIMDVDYDRLHPIKKLRPIASGEIKITEAVILMVLLFTGSMIICFFLSKKFFLVLIIYFILNILYSFKLKQFPFIDVTIIAIGFVLRIFAGAVIIDNNPSRWIIVLTFMLALFLAITKRRDDIILSNSGDKTRKNINGYNLELVNATMIIMATITIVSYIMYTMSPDVILRLKSDKLYITVIYVILGLMRYMQLTFVYEKGGSPTKLLLNDKFLQITITLWGLSFLFILYWNNIKNIIG